MATLHRLLQTGKMEAPLLRASLRGFCSEGPNAGGPGTGKGKKPANPAPPPRAAAPANPAPPPRAAAPAPPPPAAPVYQSAATPAAPSAPVGPGAEKGGAYPNTEYYCYDKLSYYDLEKEMSSDRIPQPGANNGHF